VVGDRREDLQGLAVAPPAAAQGLPVQGKPGDGRGLLLQEPLADDRDELAHIAGFEDAAEGRVARGAKPPVLVRLDA